MTFLDTDYQIKYDTSVTYKEVTVREVFEALEKNGLKHLRSNWLKTNKGLIVGGCALGQAGYNLGVASHFNWGFRFSGKERDFTLDSALNDLGHVEDHIYDDDGGIVVHRSTPLGSAIVSVNDANEGILMSNGKYRRRYKHSYDEVVKFARTILEPYFDKTIKVEAMDYSQYSSGDSLAG